MTSWCVLRLCHPHLPAHSLETIPLWQAFTREAIKTTMFTDKHIIRALGITVVLGQPGIVTPLYKCDAWHFAKTHPKFGDRLRIVRNPLEAFQVRLVLAVN